MTSNRVGGNLQIVFFCNHCLVQYYNAYLQYLSFTHLTILLYTEVLSLIREKYLQIELFDRDEVSTDLRLTLDIINQLKPLPGEEIDENIKCRSVNLVTNTCFYIVKK